MNISNSSDIDSRAKFNRKKESIANFVSTMSFKLLVFVLIQITTVATIYTYLETLRAQEQDSINLKILQSNKILRASLLRTFEVVEGFVDDLTFSLNTDVYDWETSDGFTKLSRLKDRSVPMIVFASVFSKEGNILGTTSTSEAKDVSISDRPYFKKAKEGLKKDFFGPFLGRVSNTWTLASVRRLETPFGAFNGVVLGAIDLNYIASFCKDLTTIKDVNTYVVSKEGLVIIECSEHKANIDTKGNVFFETVANGEFKDKELSKFTTSYESENWLMFGGDLQNDSGVKILTVTPKKLAHLSLEEFKTKELIILLCVFIGQLSLYLMFFRELMRTVDYRRSQIT